MKRIVLIGMVAVVGFIFVGETQAHGYRHRIGTPERLGESWQCVFPSQTKIIIERWKRNDVYKILPIHHGGVGRYLYLPRSGGNQGGRGCPRKVPQ